MELSSLSMTLLLIVLIHCGQTQGKPRLRVDPQSSVYTGDTVTLSCETPSQSDWSFYWLKDSQFINHHHQSTFSITESHPGEAEFRCIAVRGRYLSEESDPIRITVRERPKATVNVQPAGHVFIRERVTLTCEIESGDDWNYEWYKNNNLLRDAQRKKYEISNVDQTHAGDYTCKGTQSTGRIYTHTSAAVTLTVSAVKVKPTITSNPEGAALTGNTVTLYCKLHQSAGWTFYWSKHTQSSEKETITNVYTISSVSRSDGGQYWCRAGRGNPVYYTHFSDALWVNVTERPTATVNVQPAGHVFIRERVTLTCGIESGDDWNYEWYKNNNLLRDAQKKKYEISNVDQTHAVKVKPTITSNPEGAALTGNTVTLYCKLHQSAGWTFYWSKHTQSSEKETITNVYTISSVRLSDGGQYWCRDGRGNPVYYTHFSDALWVNVTGAPVSALSLLSRLVAVSPYLLVSIVLGVKCYRARAGPDEENRT
ncbi:hypothetical protein SRHO_G00332950 [Serrasalmus rhombeus]